MSFPNHKAIWGIHGIHHKLLVASSDIDINWHFLIWHHWHHQDGTWLQLVSSSYSYYYTLPVLFPAMNGSWLLQLTPLFSEVALGSWDGFVRASLLNWQPWNICLSSVHACFCPAAVFYCHYWLYIHLYCSSPGSFSCSYPPMETKNSIDYFKCVQHAGQSPVTHHTTPSHRDWVTIDYKHTLQSIHSTLGRRTETYPTTLSHRDWDLPVHTYWSTGWDMNPWPWGLKLWSWPLGQWTHLWRLEGSLHCKPLALLSRTTVHPCPNHTGTLSWFQRGVGQM